MLDYFHNAWQLEETLMKTLIENETFYTNPDPLRNFLIFYLGHSAVFYINKLISVGLLTTRINPNYEILFEVGVDPETPEELSQAISNINWPPVAQVWDYRSQAYTAITELIHHTDLNLPIHQNHPLWALMMAIEHQRIHFETSSMLLRQLPVEKLQRPTGWNYAPSYGAAPENKMRQVLGGVVQLGKSPQDQTFGWDSEYGDRTIEVKSFLASQYLVTNGEFLEFVEAGGYANPEYWSSIAWAWKQNSQINHPKFWLPTPQGYRYRATFEVMDLPLDWPAEVNYYEAIAFCRWHGADTRLMTEAEWNLARKRSELASRDSAITNSKQQNYLADNYNLNLQFISPSPVGMFKVTNSETRLYDLRGNVWEWIQDTFNPLDGFQPHPLYLDQSAPFFDNQHQMMLGGSWATNGSMALPSYRNWFRPYFYQHVGFRLAQDLHQ
ncbi:MAG: 5-histidylcysteine sulfoxide synthase [Coleofasciculaceae cyanobacterium SM2_1_6]|nr:5-histidylcysteine sulfoxide synthase [Coleofasciculaceae cyanobacterium SM2_1_6]